MLDALVAYHFKLSLEDFRFVLENCDLPAATLANRRMAARLPPKGFWRVDKEREPELRHPVLAQVAYADLQSHGLEAFLTGSDGTGWQLPATLCLSHYNLGHDDRAREPQPVAVRLGPRYLDWQLASDPATSWAECTAHANLLDDLWLHARSIGGDATTSASEAPGTITQQPELF